MLKNDKYYSRVAQSIFQHIGFETDSNRSIGNNCPVGPFKILLRSNQTLRR
jgi:hypothetical protein